MLRPLSSIFIIFSFALSGCVGITNITKTYSHNRSCTFSFNECADVFDEHLEVTSTKHLSRYLTKNDILQKLGSPYLKEIKDKNAFKKTELWHYRHDIAWRGVVLYLIVPIPLIAPVGINHEIYEFYDDELSSYTLEDGNPLKHGDTGGGYSGAIIFVCWWCDLEALPKLM